MYDSEGWERAELTPDLEGEFEWSHETLSEKLVEAGVPAEEARTTAERVWREWLDHGGRPLTRAEDLASSVGIILFLVVLVGGWLLGAGFLVWLIATRLL